MIAGSRLREGLGGGLVAAGRGAVLTGLILAEAGVLLALALVVTMAGLGFGLLLIPATLLAGRGLTSRIRNLAGKWSGVAIAARHQPQPWADGTRPSLWQRYLWLLNDQATWRDLGWMTVDVLAGWLLTLAPAALLAWGCSAWSCRRSGLRSRTPAAATGTASSTSPAPPPPGWPCPSALWSR